MKRAGRPALRPGLWRAALIAALVLLALPCGPAWGAGSPPVVSGNDSMENTPLKLPTAGGGSSAGDVVPPGPTDVVSGLPSGSGRVALALGAVVVLILLLRWIGKRALVPLGMRGGRGAAVRVLSRTMLAPRQQVLLLHVGRRVLVVGDSGGRMSSLGEIADPDEVAALVGASDSSAGAAADTARAVFGSVFRRAKEPFGDADLANEDVLAISQDADGAGETEAAPVGGLLEKVRLMRNQFKGA